MKHEVARLNERIAGLKARRAGVLARDRRWEQGQVPVLEQRVQEASAKLLALTRGEAPHTAQEPPPRR